jgi:hypothetical protein
VHLCIGQVYATSVYKTSLVAHFDTSLTKIGLIFSIAIVMLGAVRSGRRYLGGGERLALGHVRRRLLLVQRLPGRRSRHRHDPALVALLGYGVIGGIGLGSVTSRRCPR